MDMLRIEGLCKSFGPVSVLRGINLRLERGKALGLIGENGAGKSTLVRCICGYLKPDEGTITLGGKACLVPQELTFLPGMSVAENLFLGREPVRRGFVDRRRMREETRQALARIGAPDIPPDTPMGDLGVAARQKIAIAKALLEDSDLLVLDEPTAVLNTAETAQLFQILRALLEKGVSIIYISHKLEEVLELCSDIAVLRDGNFVSGGPASSYTPKSLVAHMVGRPLEDIYPPKAPAPGPGTAPILDVRGVTDGDAVRNASFTLRPGEILGLAGLAGAGRTELAELICGERKLRGGEILLNGKPAAIRSMTDALRLGIAYLSEDRQGTGLLTAFSVRENAALSSLKKYCRGPFLSTERLETGARERIETLHIRCEGGAQPVRALSGGNQQKVAIAKGLDTEPRVYIFDEPTRGVDVGARAEIYTILHRLAADGVAILLISSDLSEILGNCRRTLVMRAGRIVGECADETLTERDVMALAVGASQAG